MLSIFIQNISHLCFPRWTWTFLICIYIYYKSFRYSSNSSCQCVELYFCCSWYALGSSSQNVLIFLHFRHFLHLFQTVELPRSTSSQGALRVPVPFSVHLLYRWRHWSNIASGLWELSRGLPIGNGEVFWMNKKRTVLVRKIDTSQVGQL